MWRVICALVYGSFLECHAEQNGGAPSPPAAEEKEDDVRCAQGTALPALGVKSPGQASPVLGTEPHRSSRYKSHLSSLAHAHHRASKRQLQNAELSLNKPSLAIPVVPSLASPPTCVSPPLPQHPPRVRAVAVLLSSHSSLKL